MHLTDGTERNSICSSIRIYFGCSLYNLLWM